MKKIVPKLCFFVCLPSDSWQFQKQLMTKSETCLDFKPFRNHQYIQRKNSSNKKELKIVQRKRSCISSSIIPLWKYIHFLLKVTLFLSSMLLLLRIFLISDQSVTDMFNASRPEDPEWWNNSFANVNLDFNYVT